MSAAPPVLFLAFADDREEGLYLRQLRREKREVERVLRSSGAFEVVVRESASLDDIVEVFQEHRDRVALFHYGGHAQSEGMLLHAQGERTALVGTDLAGFLGRQRGLRFVFLNACSTGAFVEALTEAGVPAVVGTSLDVADEVATDFAVGLYGFLGGEGAVADGTTLQRAFLDAESVVKARLAQSARDAEKVPEFRSLSEGERHVRVAYRGTTLVSDAEAAAYTGTWPWSLRAAQDEALAWALRDALSDPLFGLPDLPDDIRVPRRPYRYLRWFTRDHARVFFGRGAEIRTAYRWVTAGDEPVMLLYGQSGVGKSSFLEAGLVPRLEADHDVRYLRRDPDAGLSATLAAALECGPSAAEIAGAWTAGEEHRDRPLVFIVDQVEEAYTQPLGDPDAELAQLMEVARALFVDGPARPRGRLLLSFRKEWLAELEVRLDEARLDWKRMFLRRLDRDGIIEVVRGISATPRLRARYGLEVEGTLPEIIADDLIEDVEAALAPTLQVLLTRMWEEATGDDVERPTFDPALYWKLKKEGLLLSDFLDDQLASLDEAVPGVVDSGLALDVLAFHTTPLGTARKRAVPDLEAAYAHVAPMLPDLLGALEDVHLLTRERQAVGEAEVVVHRLAHDTVAPLVRSRFDGSVRPGQRLRRALESRAMDWRDGATGSFLDERELAMVDAGEAGMRARTPDEERLVAASRERVSGERSLRGASESRELAGLGRHRLERGDLIGAAALGYGALRRAWTDEAQLLVREVAATPGRPLAVLRDAFGPVFRPDGRQIALGSEDGTVRLWDPDGGATTVLECGAPVPFVAYSRREPHVVTASEDGIARVWSAETGEQLFAFRFGAQEEGASHRVLGFDGRRIVTATYWDESEEETVRIQAVATGEELARLEGNPEGLRFAEFDPGGGRLLTVEQDGPARVWLVGSGRAEAVLVHAPEGPSAKRSPLGGLVGRGERARPSGPAAGVSAARFAPDGSLVATGGGEGEVWLWSTTDWTPVRRLEKHDERISALAFSPDGEALAEASYDGTVRVTSMVSKNPRSFSVSHGAAIVSLDFDPTGERFLTNGVDGTARIWSARTGEEHAVLRGSSGHRVQRPHFSPSPGDHRVVGHSDGTVWVWAGEGRGETRVVDPADPEIRYVGFDDSWITDSSRLVTVGADGVKEWSADTGASLGPGWRRQPGDSRASTTSSADAAPDNGLLWGVSESTDGRALITWGEAGAWVWSKDRHSGVQVGAEVDSWTWVTHPDATPDVLLTAGGEMAFVWPLAEDPFPGGFNETAVLQGEGSPILCARLLEEGRTVRVVTEDGVVRSWTRMAPGAASPWAPSGEIQLDEGPLSHALLSGDGSRALTAKGTAVRLWSVADGALLAEPGGHEAEMEKALFGPTGDRLLTQSTDGTTRIWAIPSGQLLSAFRMPGEQPSSFAFGPDGRRVAVGSRDGTVRIWSSETGESLTVLRGHAHPVGQVTFGGDGGRLASRGLDGTVRAWSHIDREALLTLARTSLPSGLRDQDLPERLSDEERRALLDS